MANLFVKLGLVEKKDAIETDYIQYAEEPTTEQVVDVKLDKVQVDTLISDIYAENNLADTSKSIFKVKELSDTLPTEMRNDVKCSTVLGILKVSGLGIDEVVNDGIQRLDILNSTNEIIVSNCSKKISDANSKIEGLKAEIEELQKDIALTEAEKEQSTKLITDEVSKITELIKFIGGNQ